MKNLVLPSLQTTARPRYAPAEIIVYAFSDQAKSSHKPTLDRAVFQKLKTQCAKAWDACLCAIAKPKAHSALFVHVGNADTLARYGQAAILKNMGATAYMAASNRLSASKLVFDWDQIAETIRVALKLKLTPDAPAHLVLGAVLAAYKIKKNAAPSTPSAAKKAGPRASGPLGVIFASKKHRPLKSDVDRLCRIAEAVYMARDLCNAPANMCTPAIFAREAQKCLNPLPGVKTKIYGPEALKKLGMHLMLSVGQGAANPPCLFEAEYSPPATALRGRRRTHIPKLALVGKGITFDSGGYNIKPSVGMAGMKFDMSGGANMLGVFYAVARLKLPVRVKLFVPLAENMVNGNATRPGDVIVSMSGQSVEIGNTDAEGRLVLADTLTKVAAWTPDAIVDMATLTSAAQIALGSPATAVMGTAPALICLIQKSAEAAGERVWELPLFPEYESRLKSAVADMNNTSSVPREAGTSIAATFLKRFVNKTTPWAHLDIAATADNNKTRHFYPQEGASGVMILTMTEFISRTANMGHLPSINDACCGDSGCDA